MTAESRRFAFAFVFAVAACSRGPETAAPAGDAPAVAAATSASTRENNPPGVMRVTIEPVGVPADAVHPHRGDTLKASARARDLDGDGIIFLWQWLVNGVPVPGAVTDTLGPGPFKKGDRVGVDVRARDNRGTISEPPLRGEIVIRNRPPVLTSQPGPRLDGYRATAIDEDGDPLVYTLESSARGFSISPDGVVRYDATVGQGSGGQVVIVVKDPEGANAKQTIGVGF